MNHQIDLEVQQQAIQNRLDRVNRHTWKLLHLQQKDRLFVAVKKFQRRNGKWQSGSGSVG
ncbi:hypothetical protein [Desmospora activa]|uniref:hypothetical protein n=1 Tax=Desmospora activa TaxID=500615 RepID=UPI0011B21947|nr:hypothetical protein [Desmospora activa]